MNFLMHAWLAGDASADRVGGLIGDFVKGPLPGNLAPDLAAGVALHRRIDSFAETHPAFRASRARVSAERRRVAGIMVDLFYDHFMAIHWSRFHAVPLSAYVAGLYRLLADEPCLPERFREFLPRMREEDWLSGYRSVERIAGALDRMAEHRLRQPNRLAGAGAELSAQYRGFESDFLVFAPAAARYAAAYRAARSG